MDFLSYKCIINKQHLKPDAYMPHFSLPGPPILHQKSEGSFPTQTASTPEMLI